MHYLQKLIQEFCPNGIEYKKLKDCTIMKRGTSLTKKNAIEGIYPVISGGKKPAFYCNQYNREDETITVAGSGVNAGFIQYWNQPIYVNDAFSIKANSDVLAKFIYYALVNMQDKIYLTQTNGSIPHVYITSIEDFEIPVPPIAIQKEIVRSLDKFTNLIDLLEKELILRKKQYAYYRDKLLTFDGLVKWIDLKTVIKKSCSGATPKKGNKEYYENGTIPWLRTQDVKFNEIRKIDSYITELALNETAVKYISENCVIIAISGATAGRCAINKIKMTTNQHCLNLEIDETKALYKYVFYCISNQYKELSLRKQGVRGDLNSSLILSLKIPLPSFEEQKYIVCILDRFDALGNSISAEIEARKKQYAYYRDKLLTFNE